MTVREKDRSYLEAKAKGIDYAARLLNDHWNGELPVFPHEIAAKLNIGIFSADTFYLEGAAGMIKSGSDGSNADIVVNKSDGFQRQAFTIAHELGHYFFHTGGLNTPLGTDVREKRGGDKTPEEYMANSFAGNLLMPEQEFRAYARKGYQDSALSDIFNVSTVAIQIRCLELGIE